MQSEALSDRFRQVSFDEANSVSWVEALYRVLRPKHLNTSHNIVDLAQGGSNAIHDLDMLSLTTQFLKPAFILSQSYEALVGELWPVVFQELSVDPAHASHSIEAYESSLKMSAQVGRLASVFLLIKILAECLALMLTATSEELKFQLVNMRDNIWNILRNSVYDRSPQVVILLLRHVFQVLRDSTESLAFEWSEVEHLLIEGLFYNSIDVRTSAVRQIVLLLSHPKYGEKMREFVVAWERYFLIMATEDHNYNSKLQRFSVDVLRISEVSVPTNVKFEVLQRQISSENTVLSIRAALKWVWNQQVSGSLIETLHGIQFTPQSLEKFGKVFRPMQYQTVWDELAQYVQFEPHDGIKSLTVISTIMAQLVPLVDTLGILAFVENVLSKNLELLFDCCVSLLRNLTDKQILLHVSRYMENLDHFYSLGVKEVTDLIALWTHETFSQGGADLLEKWGTTNEVLGLDLAGWTSGTTDYNLAAMARRLLLPCDHINTKFSDLDALVCQLGSLSWKSGDLDFEEIAVVVNALARFFSSIELSQSSKPKKTAETAKKALLDNSNLQDLPDILCAQEQLEELHERILVDLKWLDIMGFFTISPDFEGLKYEHPESQFHHLVFKLRQNPRRQQKNGSAHVGQTTGEILANEGISAKEILANANEEIDEESENDEEENDAEEELLPKSDATMEIDEL